MQTHLEPSPSSAAHTACLLAITLLASAPVLGEPEPWAPLTQPIDPTSFEMVQSKGRTCARIGPEVACWGRGAAALPRPIPLGAPLARLLDATPCGLTTAGVVVCSGATPPVKEASAQPPSERNLTARDAIRVADQAICTLHDDGSVRCGSTVIGPNVPSGPVRYDQLFPSGGFRKLQACARTVEGHLHCWRSDGSRPVRGPRQQRVCLVKKAADKPCSYEGVRFKGPVDKVSLGATELCLILVDGQARCYGTQRLELVRQPSVEGRAVDITAGAKHFCLIDPGGVLRCSGQNTFGELGDGTVDQRPFPVVVSSPAGERGDGWQRVVTLERSTCGLYGGRLYCWGDNEDGRLGVGRVGNLWSSPEPLQVGRERSSETWPAFAQPTPEQAQAFFARPHTVPLGELYAQSCQALLRPCEAPVTASKRKGRAFTKLSASTDERGRVRLASPSARSVEGERCVARALAGCRLPASSKAELSVRWTSPGSAQLRVLSIRRPARYGDRPHVGKDPSPSLAPTCYGKSTSWRTSAWPPVPSVAERPFGEFPSLEKRSCRPFEHEDEEQVDLRAAASGTYLGSIPLKDGALHGVVSLRDAEGVLRIEERWEKGKPAGRHRRWDETGGVVYDCHFREGHLVGRCRTWVPAPDDPRATAQRSGLLQSERTFDNSGRAVGLHQVWWPRGTRRESVSYPSDQRGAVGFEWPPTGTFPDVIVRGRPDGQGTRRWVLDPVSRELVGIETRDLLGARELSHLKCSDRKSHVVSVLQALARGEPSPALFDDGPGLRGRDRSRAWVASAYDLETTMGADGKPHGGIARGRPGSNVAGDEWELRKLSYKEDLPDGFSRHLGHIVLRHDKDACKPLSALGLPQPEPTGQRSERIEVGLMTHGLFAEDLVMAGDTLHFRVKAWQRVSFVDCRPVSSEEIDASQVPAAVQDRVFWYEFIRHKNAVRYEAIDGARGPTYDLRFDEAFSRRLMAWTDDERPPQPGCGALYDPRR